MIIFVGNAMQKDEMFAVAPERLLQSYITFYI